MGLILWGYRLFSKITHFRSVSHVEMYDDVVAITFGNSTLLVFSAQDTTCLKRQIVIVNSVGVIAVQLPD